MKNRNDKGGNPLKPALLALADGSVFHGISAGADGQTVGEVVFNTAMTGYQEILTDPSYAQQLVTLTYPHIGNVGSNAEDHESSQIWAAGLIIRDLPFTTSNWRSEQPLTEYLQQQSCVAITDIDTRALTQHLREKGAQSGCIMAGDSAQAEQAIAHAQKFPGLTQKDLARVVSTSSVYEWTEGLGEWAESAPDALQHHVVLYDFGVKRSILRRLVHHGCRVTVVPAETPAADVLALEPEGLLLSNGPGDPAACAYAIQAISTLLDTDIPMFGICLGHQLLALACGAQTKKMKFGHHGANHPVQNLSSQQVMISSQNHGFVVDDATLPDMLTVTHRSLFDQTIQGIAHRTKPVFSMQGHPEAGPGPHDLDPLFQQFVERILQRKRA